MSPRERIWLAVEELRARRVARRTAAPILYRFLWLLNIPIPPPLFQSFAGAMVLNGFVFGAILGAILASFDRRMAPDGAIIYGTIAGAIYGFFMAVNYRFTARRLGLPLWGEYVPGSWEEEEDDW